jgi:hypothetical protein
MRNKEKTTMTKLRLRNLLPAAVTAAVLVVAFGVLLAACGGAGQTTASEVTTSATSAASEASTAPIDNATSGSIVFSGLIDFPMTFTALDMDYMDWVTTTADDPLLGSAEFEGVNLSDVFSYVGVQPDAVTVVITAADGSTIQLTIADIPDDALLATADDDSLSTVMPGMAAEAWVKDVLKMEFK